MKPILFIVNLFILILLQKASGQTSISEQQKAKPKHTIEISPFSPFLKIYAIQYNYLVTDRSELMIGFAYANIEYDEGRSHAPTLILGFRHFIWKSYHLEYQLWPAYNNYYETTEQRHYTGFELWNEFRTGYQFGYKIGGVYLTVTPQLLCGFGIFPGNKPDSFMETVKEEPVFIYPNVFLGVKF